MSTPTISELIDSGEENENDEGVNDIEENVLDQASSRELPRSSRIVLDDDDSFSDAAPSFVASVDEMADSSSEEEDRDDENGNVVEVKVCT